MKKILSALTVIVLLTVSHITAPSTKAALVFSDSFSGGYSSSWQVAAGTSPPTTSQFGITGSTTLGSWSVIRFPTSENNTYKMEMDLLVNNDNSNSAWGLGISNLSGQWKYIGNWGQQNLLQVHDSSGSDHLSSWNHNPGLHHFELIVSPVGGTSIVVKEDGTQLESLNSIANFDIKAVEVSILGHGDYEMANFVLSTYEPTTPTPTPTPEPSPTPTPTLTPTPTASPTLTPTLTPTPTSVPPKSNKVVIVHGAGGSWNKDALLNCKTTNYSGSWSPWKIKDKDVYLPLINSMQVAGYDVLPFYYDWRRNAADTGNRLRDFIEENTSSDEKVSLVAHSFGGIVGRAYIASKPNDNKIDSFLTIGTPHRGTVFAYPAWSAGEVWINDVSIRLGVTLMKVGCAMKHGWTAREMVNNTMPATQNILPVFDYLKKTSGSTIPVASMQAKNNLLPSLITPPYEGIRVGSITGTGLDTLRMLTVQSPNRADERRGDWKDGKPTAKDYADGDGTVLSESSSLPMAESITLPLDHTALVTNQTGINTIIDFLGNQSFQTSQQKMQSLQQLPKRIKPAKNSTALLIVVDNARATLTDKDGNRTHDEDGQITILEPHNEAYSLTVIPTGKWWWRTKSKIIIIQLFDDGTSTWKEYTHSGLFHRKWKLRFDKAHKREDILRDK